MSENIYQSSKVYITIPKTKQLYSRWDDRVIWERGEEIHVVSEKDADEDCIPIRHSVDGIKGKAYLTPAYVRWRFDLERNRYPVRYPVGMKWRGKCIGALSEEEFERYNDGVIDEVTLLDYVSARKEIYVPVYERLVRNHPDFAKVVEIARRNNILIIEVDGPHSESLGYYTSTYNVSSDFIVDNTIEVTPESLEIMLNDRRHPYGHGYALGKMVYDAIRK